MLIGSGAAADPAPTDAAQSAAIVLDVLRGVRGPARDVVVLNAGAALVVAGAAEDVRASVDDTST